MGFIASSESLMSATARTGQVPQCTESITTRTVAPLLRMSATARTGQLPQCTESITTRTVAPLSRMFATVRIGRRRRCTVPQRPQLRNHNSQRDLLIEATNMQVLKGDTERVQGRSACSLEITILKEVCGMHALVTCNCSAVRHV